MDINQYIPELREYIEIIQLLLSKGADPHETICLDITNNPTRISATNFAKHPFVKAIMEKHSYKQSQIRRGTYLSYFN